ncbi:hypothetical protein PSR1_04140 [Anaeromyxobacter sp. PSR-1]|nr:hypothetical protein PSR1_04140 [Anaeromyxobacter sp. PSR-1]
MRERAAAEGERALASGDRMRAAQLFTLAGREDRVRAAVPASSAPPGPRPSAADVRKKLEKTEAEQEKFRREQADLEKELGM